jgi:hypothetical protein
MTRMNLSQLIQYLLNEKHIGEATYFATFNEGYQNSDDVVDGLIDSNIVKSYFGQVEPTGQLLRNVQANVTSYIMAK